MSRSFKKHPYEKIGDSSYKEIYNRKLRRSSRTQDIPSGKAYKKYNDSYNIRDYVCDCSWEEFKTWWGYSQFESEKEAYAYWKRHYGSK